MTDSEIDDLVLPPPTKSMNIFSTDILYIISYSELGLVSSSEANRSNSTYRIIYFEILNGFERL